MFAQRYYALFAQTKDAATALAITEREFIHGKWFVEKGGTPITLEAPLYWAGFNHLSSGASTGR
jgi:hypothetical protein